MADSERSFRDREGKARDLGNAIEGFTPAFAPADADLSVVSFTALVAQAETINNSVETLSGQYTTNADARAEAIKAIKAAVTQALSYLTSNKAWKSNCKAAKMAADKLRGIRPPKPKPPAPPAGGAPTPAETKKRNQGEQAFVELAAHFGKFIAACTGCAGYAPPAAEITLPALNGLMSPLRSANEFLSELDAQLTTAQQQRVILYYGEDGLAERFKLVKLAVKGQYGPASANCATVKGMKW